MSCQGHPTRAHWNVSLWVNSDEPLYRMARAYARRIRRGSYTAADAAKGMLARLPERTPDGYRYNVRTLRRVLVEMKRDDV
jgi:hypothetical protein